VDDDVWNDDDADETEDEEPLLPCPYCKRSIHEESQRCPYCGNYISEEDSAPARKPWWIIVAALLGFYAIYRWIAG
jgi:hypothetical protein